MCQAVYQGRPWKEQSEILTRLQKEKEEPEKIRRSILGYLSKCILGKIDDFTATKMDYFVENIFQSGFPGLILACYKASALSRGKEIKGEVTF